MWKESCTPFGEWFDDEQEEYNAREFCEEADISKDMISKLRLDKDYIPSAIIMKKVMKVVRKIDPDKRSGDFWNV